jgi:hypothetical protein
MAEAGANGGRNGRKRRTKEREVTPARRKNSRPLITTCSDTEMPKMDELTLAQVPDKGIYLINRHR